MGATEILKALEKGDRLTCVEIAKKSNCSEPSVRQGIRRLINDTSENVEFRCLTVEEKIQRYGKKIYCKVHVYWLNE